MKRFYSIDIVGIGLCVAVPAAAYWLAVAPAFRNNAAGVALTAELARQRTTQDSLEHALGSLKSSLSKAPASAPNVTLLPRTELNRRIGELNDLATARGLQVNSLNPGEPVAQPRYATIPIALSAEGSYRACEQWLADLAASVPDVEATHWSIAAATTDKQSTVHLTASLRWFCLPPEPQN